MNKLFVFFFIFLVATNSCRKKSELEKLIPEKLGNFELEQIEHNTENILIHSTIKPTNNLKATYLFKQNSAELYLYSYKDTISAISAFHYIMRELRSDTVNYKHIIPRFDVNIFFIMALKDDKANYVFTKSRYIYWLNCDKRSGENIIKDLINYSR